MSYIRKAGSYIYPTGDGIDINGQFISNNDMNLLLYAMSIRDEELQERINNGKLLFIELDGQIKKYPINNSYQLNLCPKCGGEAEVIGRYIKGVANKYHYFVHCKSCKYRKTNNEFKKKLKAIHEWNKE